MADLMVIGSLNMDLVVKTKRAPEAGETLHGLEFRTVPGGKGANQAAAAALLGASVSLVGRVGKDAFGEQMRLNLENLGVDTHLVLVDPFSPSGIASIVVDENGENRIIVVSGANGSVSTGDVNAASPEVEAAGALVLQFEIPLPTVSAAAASAHAKGVPVILNPAPAYPLPEGLLPNVDYLILNETEAGSLSGKRVKDLESAGTAGKDLLGMGAGTVVITLGALGALLVTPHTILHFPARQIEVVDTTAAGDAFTGAFALLIARGKSLEEAVKFAVAAGTLTVSRFGAQTSLPTLKEVESFLG
jgi:ribokinase